MKIFSLFICTIIVALSCAPCADVVASYKSTTSTTISSNSSKDNHKDFPADACSPFCACACCSISTVFHTTNYSLNIVKFTEIAYPSAVPAKVIATSLDVWQPPKLS
ncbi:DUF6660 family protein [Pedobacter antarcticus]|uniref:DUF6660 family protein n=1 Tax=Pedobacter antarcticus TaxID=34086 RepID=UPI003CC7DD63